MEENDVKSTCGDCKLEFNIEKDEKLLIWNLTRCKNFYSKSDQKKKIYFKIWRVIFFSIQNLTRCEIFELNFDAMYFFISKSDTL